MPDARSAHTAPFPASIDRLERVRSLLLRRSPFALAFSGGVDSRFLAHMAGGMANVGVRVHLYHIQGPHMGREESFQARAWAESRSLPITVLALNPLAIPGVKSNDKERCYLCKRGLFTALHEEVKTRPPFPGAQVCLCDGSNASDNQTFRPGRRALAELGVFSPLEQAGLFKDDIRRLATALGMDRPSQQARPCLLTRFPYGMALDEELLVALSIAEQEVAALLEQALHSDALSGDIPDFRLRVGTRASGEKSGGSALQRVALELHVGASLPEDLEKKAIQAVQTTGLSRPCVLVMQKVSGFFDRPGLGN